MILNNNQNFVMKDNQEHFEEIAAFFDKHREKDPEGLSDMVLRLRDAGVRKSKEKFAEILCSIVAHLDISQKEFGNCLFKVLREKGSEISRRSLDSLFNRPLLFRSDLYLEPIMGVIKIIASEKGYSLEEKCFDLSPSENDKLLFIDVTRNKKKGYITIRFSAGLMNNPCFKFILRIIESLDGFRLKKS